MVPGWQWWESQLLDCMYIAGSRYGPAVVSAERRTYAQVGHSLKEGDRTGERALEANS